MALNITNSTANTIISGTNENDSIINISDGATVKVKENELIQLDSATTVYIVGNDYFRIYSTKGSYETLIKVDNNNSAFSIHNAANAIDSISGLSNGFAITVDAGDNVNNPLLIEISGGKGTINYTSATSNDTTKSGNFTIEGSNLGETKIEQVRWLTNGAMIAIADLSGLVTVNGDDMGVSGDDN